MLMHRQGGVDLPSAQKELYTELQGLATSLVEGYNVCLTVVGSGVHTVLMGDCTTTTAAAASNSDSSNDSSSAAAAQQYFTVQVSRTPLVSCSNFFRIVASCSIVML
jgi:hypothetical protein